MAISFTNDQIRDMSKSILTLPNDIATASQVKSSQTAGVADLQKKDDNNKVFFNNFLNICNQYHNELVAMNGTKKATYDPATLDASAHQAPGNLHFPSTPPASAWTKFQPKVLPENTGQPETSVSGNEVAADAQIEVDLGYFLNGFADGASSHSSTTPYSSVSGITVDNASGFATGQKIIISAGSDGLFGTIATLTGMIITVNVIIPPEGTLGIGSTVKNFMAGFTNTERESGVASLQNIFNGFKSKITSEVNDYKSHLTAEQSALNANDATTPEKEEIATAKTNVSTILAAVSTWQAAPDTGTGTARWGNNLINPFKSALQTRAGQVSNRLAQINLRLGSVVQADDGSYSGSNGYLKLFDWINMRINKVSGTLLQVYMSALGGTALDQQTGGLQKQLDEYTKVFSVTKMTADGTHTNVIQVEDVAQFVVGDAVMVIDDNTNFINRTILSISGKSVTLNDVVGTEFTTSMFARLVKAK